MLDRIKAFLNQIFPMNSSRLDERLQTLENNITLALTEQNKMCGRLETKLEQSMERQAETVDAIAADVLELQHSMMTMKNLIQKMADESMTKSNELQKEIAMALDDIMHGDIFQRIEFSQSRLVRLEKILQQNMLSLETQRGSQEYAFIMRMRSLFPIVDVGHEKDYIRIGRVNDGGYVMMNNFVGKKIAYSFGIADDVSWDLDIARRGLDVYMYDHTIEDIPEQNERFHYFHIGIGTSDESSDTQLKPLEELMKSNGHLNEYGMILKLDVEGAEWDVLCDIEAETLKHFSQIVIEFHGLIFPENEEKIRRALDKINETHNLIHIHANNFGSYLLLGGAILPELLEATYLLKNECEVVGRAENVYCEADSINCIYLPDIFLDGWTG